MAERKVFKYAVPIMDEFEVMMPVGAEVIHVEDQPHHGPQMWALVDPDAPDAVHSFALRGTGHTVDLTLKHVGSFLSGPFLWHLFQR